MLTDNEPWQQAGDFTNVILRSQIRFAGLSNDA